jgi:hypothetical protein
MGRTKFDKWYESYPDDVQQRLIEMHEFYISSMRNAYCAGYLAGAAQDKKIIDHS